MQQASTERNTSHGVRWLKISVLYLIAGICLGIMMGATRDFTLRPVHAHVNLLGWAVTAVAGVIYALFPQAGSSKLATVHFWMHNLAMPVMAVSLGFVVSGNEALVPPLVISEFVAFGGVLVFAVNLFKNLK